MDSTFRRFIFNFYTIIEIDFLSLCLLWTSRLCACVSSSNQPDHRAAAQNVQCIHTSRDKGTRFYNCHQDWRLGNCGLTQVASNSPPLGSHGLCPYMYVNAFDHEFYAVIKPDDCVSKRMANYWPPKFKMGYMEKRKWYWNLFEFY